MLRARFPPCESGFSVAYVRWASGRPPLREGHGRIDERPRPDQEERSTRQAEAVATVLAGSCTPASRLTSVAWIPEPTATAPPARLGRRTPTSTWPTPWRPPNRRGRKPSASTTCEKRRTPPQWARGCCLPLFRMPEVDV